MTCGERVSLAIAKVWYSAWKYSSESKLISQSTDLVLQSQAPIQGLFHSQFQVNWFLPGNVGTRFLFCVQDQPQSQFTYVLMQREINTHFSPEITVDKLSHFTDRELTASVECDACHIAWVLGSVQLKGPSSYHYSSASCLHVEVFSSFLH